MTFSSTEIRLRITPRILRKVLRKRRVRRLPFWVSRQIAHSTLEDDSHRTNASENPKGFFLSSSPQSTLCALPSGCGCKEGSIRGSPNSISGFFSSGNLGPAYAAAGEVERLRMNEETYGGFNNRVLFGPLLENTI
ncbi:hypothetical protein F3Y22_tig00110053pilonHSYRG00024 [Hibiscus syriacus]|uniref:Uncharacterized protein n=1 Tax=Hibiscus syriacus TaxID=106335 RepID=A0A6A3BN20_HIBSY|nr:hypothetical protein F3Y22_tig00110053pilonHSYRG00024 [Hibiscus syriacus]